jgi:predicted tellurium resistance membrane protein TerC
VQEIFVSMQSAETWATLVTLATLEIVLGVDNIVFLAIMTGRLPRETRALAYRVGLAGALGTRLLLLSTLNLLMKLEHPLFTMPIAQHAVTGRDLVLIIGGLFLIGKSSHEVFESVENADDDEEQVDEDGKKVEKVHAGFWWTIAQIMVIDIVFSLDSVITAVGLGKQLWIMSTAMIIAVIVMMFFAQSIGEFVNKHPSVKVLALSFLLLIGVLLVADGLGQHVEKGYVYFAMGFSFLVEMLNLRGRKKTKKKAAAAT